MMQTLILIATCSLALLLALLLWRCQASLARARAQYAAEIEANSALRAQLAATTATLESERRSSGEKLESERRTGAERLAAFEHGLRDTFKALSADALRNSNQSFLELAGATLEAYQARAQGELEQREQAVSGLVDPIRQSLAAVDQQLRQMENSRREAYGALSKQVESLLVTEKALRDETGNLAKALRAPQVRGRWGEIQLRRVVELAGMSRHCDFSEQASQSGDERTIRPDVLVKLPGDKTVVIDAKTPLQAYLSALEAQDENTRRALLEMHARQVREHIAALGSKAYWEQFPSTPEFVVMFLPGEMFFSAALEADTAQARGEEGLIEYGISKRVVLASPTTLIALLKAVSYGWQQDRIAKNSEEISRLGKELYDRLCRFLDFLRSVGAGLGTAVKQYNDAVGSLEGRLLVTARKFSEAGVSAKEELPEVAPVEKSIREVQAPELAEQLCIALPAEQTVQVAGGGTE